MNIFLSYCGLECNTCPIRLATLETNPLRQEEMREAVINQCRELYGMELEPGDITDCDGCRTGTGRLFSGCLDCRIRNCAEKKKVETCADCSDYPCDALSGLFRQEPAARTRLDSIRQIK